MKFHLKRQTKTAIPGVYEVLRPFDEQRIIIRLSKAYEFPRVLTIVRLKDGYLRADKGLDPLTEEL